MCPPRKKCLLSLLLLCFYLQNTAAVSLSRFQAISSFPAACTVVWLSQIPGCSPDDFRNGRTCSSACIRGLEAMSEAINGACIGSRARKETLIGLFFQGLGVSKLCPNIVESDPSTRSDGEVQTTAVARTSTDQMETTTTVASTTEQQAQTEPSLPLAPSSSSLPPPAATNSTTSTPQSIQLTEAPAPAPATTSSSRKSASTLQIQISISSGTATAMPTGAGVEPASPASSASSALSDSSSASSSSSSSSSTGIPAEATRGFGGFGNAFDILAGEGSRTEGHSLRVAAGVVLAAAWVAGTAWG